MLNQTGDGSSDTMKGMQLLSDKKMWLETHTADFLCKTEWWQICHTCKLMHTKVNMQKYSP